MYLKGVLSVDPSQATKINVVEPNGSFKKLLYKLTKGKVGDKQETETFKAIAIIQQLYNSLISVGVDNIIRLNHNDIEIYYDTEGRENDFKEVVDQYALDTHDAMSTHFETLWMVLEHDTVHFKYLIEISVNRNHKVNEYPIEVLISGLLKDGQGAEANSAENVMNDAFKSQDAYNLYLNEKKTEFKSFVNGLSFELKKNIKVDDINEDIDVNLVLPNDTKSEQSKTEYGGSPFAYEGFKQFEAFSNKWDKQAFDSHFVTESMTFTDVSGRTIDGNSPEADKIIKSFFGDDMTVEKIIQQSDDSNTTVFSKTFTKEFVGSKSFTTISVNGKPVSNDIDWIDAVEIKPEP